MKSMPQLEQALYDINATSQLRALLPQLPDGTTIELSIVHDGKGVDIHFNKGKDTFMYAPGYTTDDMTARLAWEVGEFLKMLRARDA